MAIRKDRYFKFCEEHPYAVKEWLKHYLESGCSCTEIAKVFGVSRQAVNLHARAFNLHKIRWSFVLVRHKHRTHKCLDENVFEKIDSEEKAYWLGFLMADGYIKSFDNWTSRLGLTLGIKDRKHGMRFRQFLKTNCALYVGKRSCVIRVSSNKLVRDLAKYAITSKKTKEAEIKNIPEKYYRHFIRGVIDGDGCIQHRRKPNGNEILLVSVASSSIKFLSQIIDIFNSQVFDSNEYKPLLCKVQEQTHQFMYAGGRAIKILMWIYGEARICLYRKYERFQEYLEVLITTGSPYRWGCLERCNPGLVKKVLSFCEEEKILRLTNMLDCMYYYKESCMYVKFYCVFLRFLGSRRAK